MAEFTRRQKILEAESMVSDLRRQYLQAHGWKYTCNTPGSYWLWRRDFAKEDEQRHARWKERGPGPYGWPSEPQAYGVIAAGEALAISITERVLDDAVYQDGDPNTAIITAEDLEGYDG